MGIAINLLHLPYGISEAVATAQEHSKAQKISKINKGTFLAFADGDDVDSDALISAIVEGMHADVTRSSTSSLRRRQAGPLFDLYHAVRETINTAEARRAAHDEFVATLEQTDADEFPLPPVDDNTPSVPVEPTGDVRTTDDEYREAVLQHLYVIGFTDEQREALSNFRAGWEAARG
jgi:hypothetical protein